MAGKEQDYRIFVGGLSSDVTERQLEDAFGRFGKILDSQCGQNWILTSRMTAKIQDQQPSLYPERLGNCQYVVVWLMKLEIFILRVLRAEIMCWMMEIYSFADSSMHVMLERDTGRPRGFGFLTFTDRRAMDEAIREMHGREFGDRVISVNKAQPKMGEDSDHGYGGGYSSGGRGNYAGDRSVGQDDCFKCGRPGHWARDCPSAVAGRGPRPISPSRSRFGGVGGRGDRYGGDRDRYMDDRYDRGRHGDRERFDSRDDRYGSRGRNFGDRYPSSGDRFVADRFGATDRYPQNGYEKNRGYDRDEGPRGISDRYGVGGPTRYEGRSYRDRAGPYDRPRRGGRPPSFDRY